MDQNKLSAVGHATHRFQTPVFPETLDRVLAMAGLTPGARVFDLGCGHAGMSLHVARTYDAHVDAVERSPLMAEMAQARIAQAGLGVDSETGSVRLHTCAAGAFLQGAEPCDLLIGIGAIHLAGAASTDPIDMLKALAVHVRPGGALLWGETCWVKPPSELLLQMLGPLASQYKSHADSAGAGEAAGLQPLYAVTASDQEWDEYAWRYVTAVESYAAAHPDDPDSAPMRLRVQAWRALYLHQARGVMGFGLYLFRKPG